MNMKLEEEWHRKELNENEEEVVHDPMDQEYLFYQAVTSGNMEYVQEIFKKRKFEDQAGKGVLSKNPLTNIKYHFIVTAAIITRNCVLAGMVQEQAYRLSDFYIIRMDECKSIQEVCNLHQRMVYDYTQRMLEHQKSKSISKAVTKTIEYIYNNIHERITLEEIAESVQLSPSHLSRLFKKEMGASVSDYIRDKKIERAKNLLRYSDFSFVEIANYLSFASQSHFIKTFEEYEGMTPKKYRDQFYRAAWQTEMLVENTENKKDAE